jgi:tetratricopeptide (TPR) repeat protein
LSRPLTPTNFSSTPSPVPRVTPSAPISRVTPRPSQPDLETLDANGKFKRVDQLCQRHAYDEALPIIRALVEEDRKNAKYLGMLAHVLLGRTTDGQIGKDIVETVNLALRIDTDEIRALYTKARCYKRMGKEREALHYFKRTVAVEPNHLDATREIRLLLLRLSEKRKR